MKFYISAKWQMKDVVSEMVSLILYEGHEVPVDWTKRAFDRDYENFDLSSKYAKEEIDAILESDVFIHLTDVKGIGKYIDLGCALANVTLNGKPEIYIIGEKANESQFYFHPKINRIVGDPIKSLDTIILPNINKK